MWIEFSNNPVGRNVGDCTVRAVSLALGVDWETAYTLLADAGLQMGNIMNANEVVSAVLRMHGFHREGLPHFCPDCYTVKEFARDNSYGVYVLGTGTHFVTVIDGDYYDMWDSGNAIPQYFWMR